MKSLHAKTSKSVPSKDSNNVLVSHNNRTTTASDTLQPNCKTRNAASLEKKSTSINHHRVDSVESGSVPTKGTRSNSSSRASSASSTSSSSSRSSDHLASTIQKNGKSSEQSKSSKQSVEKQTPSKTISKPSKSQPERTNNSVKKLSHEEISQKNDSKKESKQEAVVDLTQTLELRHQNLSSFPEAHVAKTELVKLDISFNSFSELDMLTNFPKLVSFKAMYNKLKNLDGIELCEQLKDCNMTGNAIEDVTKLAFCKKLETLSLDGNKIASFPSLSSLKCLTSLSVDNNCLKTFDGISGLENITTFSAARNCFEKLTGLGKCRFRSNLLELDLSFNMLDKADFACLPTFDKLEVLRLKNCNLSCVEIFPICFQIRVLVLSGNLFESLNGIESRFPHLESLDIRDNLIPHVKQLQESISSLSELEMLYVSGNPMCDINSNYVKILSTHVKNLRLIDEVRVNALDIPPEIDQNDSTVITELGYAEPTFDDKELLDQVLKREQTSLKEAEEVKALFSNLEKQTRKLEKTFENSLYHLDANLNEIKKGILFNLDFERNEKAVTFGEVETQSMDMRSSQTLDLSDIRKAMNKIEKKSVTKLEDMQTSNVRKSLNHIERIRAAQQYSKNTEMESNNKEPSDRSTELIDDLHFVAGGHSVNDTSEKVVSEVEQFLYLLNSKTAERKVPPSSTGGLKVRRKNKDS